MNHDSSWVIEIYMYRQVRYPGESVVESVDKASKDMSV